MMFLKSLGLRAIIKEEEEEGINLMSSESEGKRTIFAFNLSRSKQKRSFVLENVKYRSETTSISLQLVKMEAKTNLVRSLVRSKTK
jgi:hypothetical protein